MAADNTPPREGEILLYTGASGAIRVEVLFEAGGLADDAAIRKFRIAAGHPHLRREGV